MNLTNLESCEDKENINNGNLLMPSTMKRKIEKKTVTKRYKNAKTVEAIKRLTLDLKLKIASAHT